MNREKKNIKNILNQVYLPFIKLKLDNKFSFKRGLEKRKEEIDIQAQKLVASCENLKIDYSKKKERKKEQLALKKLHTIKTSIFERQLSNDYNISKLQENSSTEKNSKSKNKKNIKRAIEYNYLLLKERYSRYNNKLKEREKNSRKYFSLNDITNNDSTDEVNKYYSFSNQKIPAISSWSYSKENKENNNTGLFITNIWNLSSVDETKYSAKNRREKLSKLNLILKDTNDKIDQLDIKLKKFDKESRNNSPKSLRNLEYIINEDKKIKEERNKINYKKILSTDKRDKYVRYIKINLNKNKEINKNNYSFIKKSTADLIKYCQSLQLMPDDYFYRERKRIIQKYPLLQKQAKLSFKSLEIDKNSHKVNYKKLIEKNCNKMSNLADKNIILFNKVIKK